MPLLATGIRYPHRGSPERIAATGNSATCPAVWPDPRDRLYTVSGVGCAGSGRVRVAIKSEENKEQIKIRRLCCKSARGQRRMSVCHGACWTEGFDGSIRDVEPCLNGVSG